MTARQRVRRVGSWINVGNGADTWSFPCPQLAPSESAHGPYFYLLHTCPTTGEAVSKLRDMRRALAALVKSGGEETSIP